MSRANRTVMLDAEAAKMVKWYAEKEERDPADVVNGLLSGYLRHARDKGTHDDSLEHTREYVLAAIKRRKAKGGSR